MMRLPRFRLALACLVLLLSLSSVATATVVRVATYNVENYLLTDLVTEHGWRPSYPKPEKSKEALRAAIAAVNPDVLALQEMGDEPFLKELQRDLRIEGIYYPYAYVLSAEDENRHVAVLSRLPFAELHGHTDLSFPYFGEREKVKRGLLEIVFETEGERWALFVVHLKSKWTERRDDPQAALKRTGEATAARNRILQRHDPAGGALYLIAGDFNDTRDTPPLRRFLQRGNLRISSILPAADSRGHTWTQNWERQNLYSRIDFLLPSPALFERVLDGRGYVYDAPGSEVASDHRMVWADLRFGPGEGLVQTEPSSRGARLVRLLKLNRSGGELLESEEPPVAEDRDLHHR